MPIRKRFPIALLIMIPCLFIDRLTKYWAENVLQAQYGGSMPFLKGIVGFKYAENTGVAFSGFAGNTLLLIGVTSLIVIILIICLIKIKNLNMANCICLLLMISGGTGNLWDRLVNGYVTDFINPEFMRFAIFNFADILVCLGAFGFALSLILEERRIRHADR